MYPTVGIQHVIRFGIRGDYDLDDLILYDENLSYLHADHLGSSSLATDANGGVISEMRYYPYGGTRTGEMGTDRRYTGQRLEVGTGLYDYNARYYDATINRFIQADTIVPEPGNPQALNRYSYVNNRPLYYVDPTGHCPTCLIFAGAGALALGGLYLATTETPTFSDLLAVAAVGAGAGALIGTGVGAATGAIALSVQVTAITGAAGVGMASSGVTHLIQSRGEDLDVIDFTVESIGGGVNAAIDTALPFYGYPIYGAEAVGGYAVTSALVETGEYFAKEILHGRDVTLAGTGNALITGFAQGYAAQVVGQVVFGNITVKQLYTGSMPERYWRPPSIITHELLSIATYESGVAVVRETGVELTFGTFSCHPF